MNSVDLNPWTSFNTPWITLQGFFQELLDFYALIDGPFKLAMLTEPIEGPVCPDMDNSFR